MNKKGMYNLIVVFVIVVMLMIVLTTGEVNVIGKIGEKQTAIIQSYSEAEKIRDYASLSAKFAFCSEEDTTAVFNKYRDEYPRRLKTDSGDWLEIEGMNNYILKSSTEDSITTLKSSPGDIIISSEKFNFEYSFDGSFEREVDSENC